MYMLRQKKKCLEEEFETVGSVKNTCLRGSGGHAAVGSHGVDGDLSGLQGGECCWP